MLTIQETKHLGHFVYIYRDLRGHVLYVGYGESAGRSASHQSGSHNSQLDEYLRTSSFRAEIAGPFGSEETGRAVETALISALSPRFNVAQGATQHRFRPLGVPEEYADRVAMDALDKGDFLAIQSDTPRPVLFVRISSEVLSDGRVGFDLAKPPADDEIVARLEKWWQLRKWVPEWIRNPDESPASLVGVHGKPGEQVVIAAMRIRRGAWSLDDEWTASKSKVRVPIDRTGGLDRHKLRGRRIAKSAGIAFEWFPAGFFCILWTDGQLVGGRRSRRSGPPK